MEVKTSLETKTELKGKERPTMHTLEIKNLHATVEDQEILKGLNLTIKSGEIHAIMGPNGSGKSTLCKVLMGHPSYEVTDGEVLLDGQDILEMEANERANLGLFLAFQQPLEIPGVSLGNFLRIANNANIKARDENAKEVPPTEFIKDLKAATDSLKMEREFIGRSVNEGFSGGERKRAEIAQMKVLKPKLAFLDEIDSGLDIDALKIVSEGIKDAHEETNLGILLITHYQRILNYINPHHVHIMHKGKIIKSGDHKLAEELEANGYENLI